MICLALATIMGRFWQDITQHTLRIRATGTGLMMTKWMTLKSLKLLVTLLTTFSMLGETLTLKILTMMK